MQTYYHVTTNENWTFIQHTGLIPQIGYLSALFGEPIPRIYLFKTKNDMETALSSWLGEELNERYGEDYPCCSLKITLPDEFPVEQDKCGYEIHVYQTIPPKYITYFHDE